MTLLIMIYFTYKSYLMVFSKDTNGIMKWLENKGIEDIFIMVVVLEMITLSFICVCFWE